MVKILSSPRFDVFAQMALDEVLVGEKSLKTEDLCRFFNWSGGVCATFGYAQFYQSCKAQFEALGITEYTRRPTGGGIVLHKDDLTFSLIFNYGGVLNVRQIYDKLHGLIREGFERSGIKVDSYGAQSDYRPAPGGVSASCFTNPVGGDLMAGGRKILGGAMRRYGGRILYQGSLQYKDARGNGGFEDIIARAFAEFLGGADLRKTDLPPDIVKEAESLALGRYRTQSWIGKF